VNPAPESVFWQIGSVVFRRSFSEVAYEQSLFPLRDSRVKGNTQMSAKIACRVETWRTYGERCRHVRHVLRAEGGFSRWLACSFPSPGRKERLSVDQQQRTTSKLQPLWRSRDRLQKNRFFCSSYSSHTRSRHLSYKAARAVVLNNQLEIGRVLYNISLELKVSEFEKIFPTVKW